MNPATVEGGFADPVFDAQRAFRAVMDAVARPGRIADLGGLAHAPEPVDAATAAILLTLCDAGTPVFLEEAMTAAAGWVAFQTGAPMAAGRQDAHFAVLVPGSDCGRWRQFPTGTSDYPDRSATLILPVTGFTGGARLALSGPGIETVETIAPPGLPEGFTDVMRDNRAGFPLGFDVLLTAGDRALALPRTTRILEL